MGEWKPQTLNELIRYTMKNLPKATRGSIGALNRADDAQDIAVGAAQDAADAAAAALQAAGIAADKGTVYTQPSAPDPDPNGLWIDTDDGNKTYITVLVDGVATWVVAQDAGIQAAAEAAAAAKAAADAAKAAAEAAQDTADEAKGDAAAAQGAADAATGAAGAAQGTANGAAQTASAAQQAAGAAATAASTAQQRADAANQAALDAAGVANGKGKVIYQVSKPTGANAATGNLWIRTSDNSPWAYDATIPDWVRVTDKAATDAAAAAAAANTAAGTAQTAANAAQQRADLAVQNAATAQGRADQAYQVAVAAQTAATNAQTSANGKNTIRYRSAAPTTSAADAGAADGDIWFVITNPQTGIVTGQYTWVAPTQSWLQQTLSSALLTSIDAGKITTGTLVGITITGVTITGATVTGGIVQTAVSGQRAVLSGSGIRFFDANEQPSGQINGWINGASGGLIQISPGPDTDALYIGTYYLPVGGTAAVYSATAYHPTLYVDEMLNASTGERFQGTYIGTRTQAVGNGAIAGIGAFNVQAGSATSFITMGSDGRFTLISGAYLITVTMSLLGAKSTGRTFVEFIDVNDPTRQLTRGNMTPNVGEDTTSTASAVNVDGSRLFRVQTFQTSGGSQNVKFTLGVTKVG